MNQEDKKRALAELPGVSEEVYDELLHGLCRQAKERLPKLQEALDSNDLDAVKDLAHFISGCAGNLRVETLYQHTKDLQKFAEDKEENGVLLKTFNLIEQALADVEKIFD